MHGPVHGEDGPDLRRFLARVRTAGPQHVGPLEVVPLWIDGEPARRYPLGHEAIGKGALRVTERAGGRMQVLEARNSGDEPVLIPEGDTFVGCRQNRVVAHSVLVPPGGRVELPVGCVERGRWDPGEAAAFRSGSMRVSPLLRSSASDDARRSRRAAEVPSLRQLRLWRDVDRELRRREVDSDTSDYHAVLTGAGEEARSRAREFVRVRNQVGMIAVCRGTLLGIELAGHPATWSAIEDRTLPTYLLAAEQRRDASGGSDAAPLPRRSGSWLEALRCAEVRERPGLGLGTDLELRGSGFAGCGLWHDGSVVCAAVFGGD